MKLYAHRYCFAVPVGSSFRIMAGDLDAYGDVGPGGTSVRSGVAETGELPAR